MLPRPLLGGGLLWVSVCAVGQKGWNCQSEQLQRAGMTLRPGRLQGSHSALRTSAPLPAGRSRARSATAVAPCAAAAVMEPSTGVELPAVKQLWWVLGQQRSGRGARQALAQCWLPRACGVGRAAPGGAGL